MTRKVLNVNKLVVTPQGTNYSEPIMDNKGRVKLTELDDNGNNIYKFSHMLTPKDEPVYEDKKIGNIITHALDKTDDKLTGEDIRKRFALSCRVEDAMSKNESLIMEQKDWKCIENSIENIKNPLFNYRIQEAVDTAELYVEKTGLETSS